MGEECEGLTLFMQSRVPLGPGKFHVVVLLVFSILTGVEINDIRLILLLESLTENDMIEYNLRAKDFNRGQLCRLCWISSARCSKIWSIQLAG